MDFSVKEKEKEKRNSVNLFFENCIMRESKEKNITILIVRN